MADGEAADASPQLPPYTAEEFQASVLTREPRTAVFDCDGTLWEPDSGLGFMRWSFGRGLVDPKRRSWIEERYRLYEAGKVEEAAICGEMVQIYAGLPEELLRRAAAAYVAEHVLPRVFPALPALVRALQTAGADIWAVSSTSNWVVEAGVWSGGASPFQIPPGRVLAAKVAVVNFIATDRLLTVPTDEAKALALIQAGLPHPDVVFGNSLHDAAMLELAGQAYPVNPTPELTGLAASRGWRVFMPASARLQSEAHLS